eukprot:scaffold17774_cov61-Phaeocystis_antarctica.AAC.2
MGLITGRAAWAMRVAWSAPSPVLCMSRRQPVVPARCAPARQCISTELPAARAPSTKSKSCCTKAITSCRLVGCSA